MFRVIDPLERSEYTPWRVKALKIGVPSSSVIKKCAVQFCVVLRETSIQQDESCLMNLPTFSGSAAMILKGSQTSVDRVLGDRHVTIEDGQTTFQMRKEVNNGLPALWW